MPLIEDEGRDDSDDWRQVAKVCTFCALDRCDMCDPLRWFCGCTRPGCVDRMKGTR